MRSVRVVVVALLAALLVPVTAGGAAARAGGEGLPPGIPPAALRPEPALPEPSTAAWPFDEAFPRTSGTGRLQDGAFFWSDFLYDDHGASGGVKTMNDVVRLALTEGTYSYASPDAKLNGADIFRVGIGADAGSTYWRVDWNTLVNPAVPAAVFTFDTDANPATGSSAWPAGAGASSPGIDLALVLTGTKAELISLPSGLRTPVGLTVDLASRSFIAKVPRTALDPSETWRVRLGAGVANAAGDGVAPVTALQGNTLNAPPLYNLAFRDYVDEPQVARGPMGERAPQRQNFWFEDVQAAALQSGDVSAFSVDLDWDDLADETTEPEPRPSGYTNRWFVSSIEPGQGVVQNLAGQTTDLLPNFLGRVQPYSVYVPTGYDGSAPVPLTLWLHSLSVMHNQYGAYNPNFVLEGCEDRTTICAAPLGRGPDLWYTNEGELDTFEVWGDVARHYRLDPDATTTAGFSMGGFGSYRLGLSYPDLFAAAFVLAGPPICGIRAVEGGESSVGTPGSICDKSSDTGRLVGNARWLPFYIGHGTADELVPITSAVEQAQRFQTAGYRYRFETYPAEGHIPWASKDAFGTPADSLVTKRRAVDPGHVTLAWFPHGERDDLGVGTSGAWWVRGAEGRNRDPGVLARIDADSGAKPGPAVTLENRVGELVTLDPSPGVFAEQSWVTGATPAETDTIVLALENVAALTLELDRAGFADRSGGRIEVTDDGATALTLADLAPGTPVRLGQTQVAVADSDGRAAVSLPAGQSVVTFGEPGTSGPAGPDAVVPELPLPLLLPLAAALLLGLLVRRRRSPGAG